MQLWVVSFLWTTLPTVISLRSKSTRERESYESYLNNTSSGRVACTACGMGNPSSGIWCNERDFSTWLEVRYKPVDGVKMCEVYKKIYSTRSRNQGNRTIGKHYPNPLGHHLQERPGHHISTVGKGLGKLPVEFHSDLHPRAHPQRLERQTEPTEPTASPPFEPTPLLPFDPLQSIKPHTPSLSLINPSQLPHSLPQSSFKQIFSSHYTYISTTHNPKTHPD
jgi:hypothetical protein